MRKEITEEMITELMAAIPRAEEVDRLRAEIERLQKEADLTREALGGWALVPPDGGADPTHERVAAVVAEVEKLRAALQEAACACPSFEYHCASTWARQDGCAHMTARKALEGKP
jgi:hypothetical protein